MKTFSVVLNGISPLIVHRNSPELEALQKKQRDNEARKRIEEENYHLYLYVNLNGPYVPSLNLLRCFTSAAKEFRLEGHGKKSYRNIIGGGFIIISPDEIPLIGKYEPFKTYVKIQNQRVLRVRPIFPSWSLKFKLMIMDGVDPARVRDIVDYAGLFVGLGDFRPERGGPYGRFVVEEWRDD